MAKTSRNRDAADITVDDPSKAMQQFTDGLKRVLAAPKFTPRKRRKRRAKQ